MSISTDENEQSITFDDLAPPATASRNCLSNSWHPRTRKSLKSKMGSRHVRKYSSDSIDEESASSLFYVDPFGNDCENVEELEKRGRTIESQRSTRRNSLPPAVCKSDLHTASTAPPPSIVLQNAERGRSDADDDGTAQRRRRAPRRRCVAGNPRRCKAVDADSMTDFNMSMSMMSTSMHG